MKPIEFIVMLRELVRDASYSITDPDDWSGISTKYVVDHEQLMANIETKLAELEANYVHDDAPRT